METNVRVQPPTWYWVVSVLALLWNGMGAMAYLGQELMGDDIKAALPPEQVELLNNTPAWVTAAFAIAVWGGLLGCIGLLMRKKWAKTLLLISLLAALVQIGHNLFMTNAAEVYGAVQAMVMPGLVILIGILLWCLAVKAEKKQWIV